MKKTSCLNKPKSRREMMKDYRKKQKTYPSSFDKRLKKLLYDSYKEFIYHPFFNYLDSRK